MKRIRPVFQQVIFRLLAFFSFFALSLPAWAQSVVFEQELQRYVTAEGASYKNILSLVGSSAKISYQYRVTVKVVAGSSPGLYSMAVYAEPEVIGGNRRMDGFDISSRLWPDSLTIQFALDQPGGAIVIGQTLAESGARLREGLKQNLQTTVDWRKVRLMVKLSQPKYSDRQLDELVTAKNQISRYVFVTGGLANLPADLKRFEKVDDPDTLDARLRELSLLEAAIPDVRALIATKPFWLTETDAKTTENLIAENSALIADLKAKLEKQAAGIRELVSNKANKLFRTARRGLALPYYKRLMALDPSNDQAIDRVVLLSVEAGQLEPAIRTLIENAGLMQGFSHQRTVDKAGRALEVSVLKKMKSSNADLAKTEVYLLDSLCKKFPGYRCPNLSYTKAATPVRDGYAKLMNRARVETSLDKLDAALATIAEALKTAEEGGLPIANQQSALNLQRQIAERYVSKQCYLAQTAYRKAQDSLGTEHLAAAAQMATRFDQKPTEMYTRLLKTNAEPYVLSLAKQSGDEPAQVNARKNAGRYIAILKLDSDKKITAVAATTSNKLSSSECKRAQADVNELVNKGVKQEKELDFIDAQTAYTKALDLSRRKAECLINNAFLLEKLASVEKPARYQTLIAKAEEHLDEKRYDSAFATYANAEQLYDAAKLAELFLVGVSVPATVRIPKYAGFALFAGERYLKLNELDSALTMAQISAKGKASKDDIKDFAIRLAEKLAERDKKSGAKAEPRQLALKYSGGDKRLKEFEKAYLKAWNIVQP